MDFPILRFELEVIDVEDMGRTPIVDPCNAESIVPTRLRRKSVRFESVLQNVYYLWNLTDRLSVEVVYAELVIYACLKSGLQRAPHSGHTSRRWSK